MEELIELLEEIQPDADFENCDTLIDDGILDSFAILSIVSELQDTYDITITPADIIPENFNSAKALWDMVCRLKVDLYKADNWNYNPVVCFSVERLEILCHGK